MSPPRGWVDLSDPRVAAELEQLAAGAERMADALAQAEAAARRHAAEMAAFAGAFAPPPAPPVPPVVVLVVAVLPPGDEDAPPAEPFRH